MDKPKGNPLRPQTMLELLDRAFNIYRENFVAFFGLVAAVTIPVTVINLAANYWYTNQWFSTRMGSASLRSGRADVSALTTSLTLLLVLLLITIGAAIIQGVIVSSILSYMTSERHLGRVVGVREAFNAVRPRLANVGVGLVLFYVILILAALALTVLLWLCGLGFGLIGYLGVTLYAFLVPVLVLERTDLTTGMKRAWLLAKARVWPVLGLIGAVALINWIFGQAVSWTGLFVTRQSIAPASFGAAQALQLLVQSVVAIFLAPVLPIGLTLLYYDARVRLEGLDIALQSVNVPDPRPADVPSPEPPPGWFMSSDDYRNVGLFMIGGIVVVGALCGLSFLLVGGTSRLFF
jgi:hypothetical protein